MLWLVLPFAYSPRVCTWTGDFPSEGQLFRSAKWGFYKRIREGKGWLLNVRLFICGFMWISLLRLLLQVQNWNPVCVHPGSALRAPAAAALLAWGEAGGWGGSSPPCPERGVWSRLENQQCMVKRGGPSGLIFIIRENNQIIALLVPPSAPLHSETVFIFFGNREPWHLASLGLGLDDLGQSIFIFKCTSTSAGAEGACPCAYLVGSPQHAAAAYVVLWMLVWWA